MIVRFLLLWVLFGVITVLCWVNLCNKIYTEHKDYQDTEISDIWTLICSIGVIVVWPLYAYMQYLIYKNSKK